MSVQLESAIGERLKFGQFELAPVARILRRRGKQVKLGSRALDILIALASQPGQILSKDDLTHLVWRGASVDETALRVGISAVRKALGAGGDRYIATVPGRGYCFVLDVEITAGKLAPDPPQCKRLKPQRLPAQIAQVVGRDEVIASLVAEGTRRRLLSLVGAGGIGKTTVALAVADRLRTAFDAVAFVDLAPIENGIQMSAAAQRLSGSISVRSRIRSMRSLRQSKIVAFSSYSTIVSISWISRRISSKPCSDAPDITVLATSRERLRAAGEWVHQLSPLEAPPKSSILSAEEVRRYPAVEMFEERAEFALGGYQISDTERLRRRDLPAAGWYRPGNRAGRWAAGRARRARARQLSRGLLLDPNAWATHGCLTPPNAAGHARLEYRLLSPEDQAALRCLSDSTAASP